MTSAERQRAWRARNPERAKEHQRRYLERHPDRRKASVDKHNSTDAFRERNRKWRRDNPGKVNAVTARRYASKRNATPSWLSVFETGYMQAVYIAAAALGMHVDHIVPLRHPLVCGLHVPWNLQMLTPDENRRKNNRFEVG